MKITSSLIIGISALCAMFTACSSEDEVNTPTPPQQEQEFYHKIQVQVTKTNLRLFEGTEIAIHYTQPVKEKASDQYLSYDSIVWNIPEIFTKVSKDGYNLVSSTQSFHLPGEYQISILGYKDGKIISGDSAKIDVKQSGNFLGQDWNNLQTDRIFNFLNKEKNIAFDLRCFREPIVYSILRITDYSPFYTDEEYIQFYKNKGTEYYEYITSLYGKPIFNYEKEDIAKSDFTDEYNKRFAVATNQISSNIEYVPIAIWETSSTVISLLRTDFDLFDEPLFDFTVVAQPRYK